MRRFEPCVRWVVAFVFALCVGSVAGRAGAQPATAGVLQLGAGAQYGVSVVRPDKPNPWGLGLGLGLGYTLPSGFYAGGQFEYFFGEEDATYVGNEVETLPATEAANIWDVFAELGYDLALGDAFVLRGKGDVGFASYSSEFCIDSAPGVESYPCEDASEINLLIGPGAAFLYLGRSFSLTLEARYDFILTRPSHEGLIFSLGIGF
jgi:hypothetical protein